MVEWREAMAPELKPAGATGAAGGATGTTGTTTGGTGASGCYSILLLTAGQYLALSSPSLHQKGYLKKQLS